MGIPEDKKTACHGIIHTAAVACGGVGAGLAQLPGTDNAIIVPIQAGMIVGLALVFGKVVGKETAIVAMGTQATTVIGRGLSQVLVGWIPVLGNAINASTATAVTEALGWAVANLFSKMESNKENLTKDDIEDLLKEASKKT